MWRLEKTFTILVLSPKEFFRVGCQGWWLDTASIEATQYQEQDDLVEMFLSAWNGQTDNSLTCYPSDKGVADILYYQDIDPPVEGVFKAWKQSALSAPTR